MSPSSCWSTPWVSDPSLLRGGGVEPNVDTFEPFTLPEIMSGLRYGVVGRFPDMPPSEAIGTGTWDWEEDALFTIDQGDGRMRIFHIQNSTFNATPNSVFSLLDPENLIMDGDTIVGLNMEAWYDSISSNWLDVRYESVPMVSVDQAPRPDDFFTSTKAVWFQAPSGLWVAGNKSRITMRVDLDSGQEVDVVFTRLVPNYYLQTERDAEVVARIVLGDFDSCGQESGTNSQGSSSQATAPCIPFFEVPKQEVPSSLLDPPRDLSDFGSDGKDVPTCGDIFRAAVAAPGFTQNAAINVCDAATIAVGGAAMFHAARQCGLIGAAVCGAPCAVVAAVGCAVIAGNAALHVNDLCRQAAWNNYMASYSTLFAEYLGCCLDRNKDCDLFVDP